MLTKEQFDVVYANLNVSPKLHKEFVYECFELAAENAKALSEQNVFGKALPVNYVVVILYLINEYAYFIESNPEGLEENDELIQKVATISLDKYFTNEHLNFKNQAYVTRYAPPISTIETYLNFILSVLSRVKSADKHSSVIIDVLSKGFSMCKAITDLMDNGFSTEAFSTWRTLHETECIVLLLTKYGKPIINEYLKHINYTMAFRGIIHDKEAVDATFVQIKEEMRKLDLKSKDMKKYIEYGWLIAIPDFNKDPQFKFNFRDGVEKLAGLEDYSKVYEMASEIAHSSPMLIYSKSSYFTKITLLNLYESFFRLERVFADMFVRNSPEEDVKRFELMKRTYYTNLQIIYRREKESLKKMTQKEN